MDFYVTSLGIMNDTSDVSNIPFGTNCVMFSSMTTKCAAISPFYNNENTIRHWWLFHVKLVMNVSPYKDVPFIHNCILSFISMSLQTLPLWNLWKSVMEIYKTIMLMILHKYLLKLHNLFLDDHVYLIEPCCLPVAMLP